eukprot:GHVU01032448.1.p1 GENE.GHVU01032448.1~~GHVU01032448.1.p1  ORF type:complete len:135 (-),score=6.80 GHVU01032448.1:458-862(-)
MGRQLRWDMLGTVHACLCPCVLDWTAYIQKPDGDTPIIINGLWSTILHDENIGSLSALRRVLDDSSVKRAKNLLQDPQLYMRTVDGEWISLQESTERTGWWSSIHASLFPADQWKDLDYLPKHLEFLIASKDGT